MNDTALQQLEHEVNRFRTWADGYDRAQQYGEWECDYEGWPAIYEAFRAFLSGYPHQEWDPDTLNLLLYILARDNEGGQLASDVAQEAERLLLLGRASLASNETDAKWQLAAEISRLSSHYSEVEALLLKFIGDEDEYVRRQALMGLGRIKSPAVESLVETAWDTEHEYQRMGVLNALHRINSPRLAEFKDRAIADGRKYLVGYTQRVHLEAND